VIHQLEMFPASAVMEPGTLVTVNPTTRPSPMSLSKKNHWPPAPKSKMPLQECSVKKAVVGCS